jgi:truncated hemoglobin YjbI
MHVMKAQVALLVETDSLVERVGGPSRISWVVDDLYDRVMADETLASAVAKLDHRYFTATMTRFLVCALGGAVSGETGDPNAPRVDLDPEQFLRFARHLLDVLVKLRLPAELLDRVCLAVATAAVTSAR